MKRSGFKQQSFQEKLAKKIAAQERATQRSLTRKPKSQKPLTAKNTKKKKSKVKYPTILGIKATRYTGIKGCLWAIFSKYVRKRDFVRYAGRCISCPGTLEDWKHGDAGHYVSVSRGNFETLFDEKNVHLQCKRCNNPTWTPDASIPFAYELDRRLGPGTAEDIYRRSQTTGQSFSELEYMRKIEHYKELFDKL